MSSPSTIVFSGRTSPCCEGCRHPTRARLAREAREARAAELVATVQRAIFCDGDARAGLDALYELARGG